MRSENGNLVKVPEAGRCSEVRGAVDGSTLVCAMFVLRQVGQIQPGMRRKDLLKVFTTEGGISSRFQRTYVHRECPYIKVDVLFRGIEDPHNSIKGEPDDIIVSIRERVSRG